MTPIVSEDISKEKMKVQIDNDFSATQRFMDSTESPILDKIFQPIIKLMTSNRYINLNYEFINSPLKKIPKFLLDIISARIEKKLGITLELRRAMFGNKGLRGKRSAFGHFLNPIIKQYLYGWKKRQKKKIEIPKTVHKVESLPTLWKGWKKLREEVCPNFNLKFDPNKHKTIKILPEDILTPKDRINRLVEFKDVDRVGFGPTITHGIALMGAQPEYKIGGLWQHVYGPGNKMAKALINTWIRIGGCDFMPTPMAPMMMNPMPETHSPFYFEWTPPSDLVYEQFIEKELIKIYDDIYDWGLSSLAQEVSKAVIYRAITSLRELIKSQLALSKYFGKDMMNIFEPYTLSIFALWDVIPMARSMIPFFKDLRKKPEEIIQIFEFLEPGLTELGIALAKIAKAKYVLVGNSRGSNSWISPKKFEEIFWSTQKATCEKIIKAGFKLCCHLDNDWTQNMEYMLELPKHSGFFHLDQADLPKVREIIGDHFCLMGNLSPAITTGSGPEKVYQETKRLIETCGKDGGYIVATGCEAPATIPIENFYAMKRAIKDHGYYKR